MKTAHTPEEKIALVEGYEIKSGKTIPEYCKAKGINTSQYYTWRKDLLHGPINRSGKMVSAQGQNLAGADQLKKLETQNEVLKEMLADAYKHAA